MQPKMGGKFHLKLNIGTRPIANKYREGKMKSTLKRESKGREAVKMEPFEASNGVVIFSLAIRLCQVSEQFKAFGVWILSRMRDVIFIIPCQHEFEP
jgi:hypothetical protein